MRERVTQEKSVSDLMVMSVEFQVMSLDQAIVEVAGRGCIIPAF